MNSRPGHLVIHSGGQTGIDRAALDAALAAGVPCGGWCPRGRRAEDGPLPARYPLRETPSDDYAERTAWNVRDADATLVLTLGPVTGGTALTVEVAERLGTPLRVVEVGAADGVERTAEWVRAGGFGVLNVAGPRESTAPGVYGQARAFMERLLAVLGA
ncbi:MAG: putative molybdenum carrier protein [Rhodothermales bacterium]|nr:putative molybdenum carrier protein [Rhodothermales bacterium]